MMDKEKELLDEEDEIEDEKDGEEGVVEGDEEEIEDGGEEGKSEEDAKPAPKHTREQRQQEKRDRRARTKNAKRQQYELIARQAEDIKVLREELDSLKGTQGAQSQHLVNQYINDLDGKIASERLAIQNARNFQASARQTGNVQAEQQAEDALFEARDRLKQYEGQKTQVQRDSQERAQPQTTQQPKKPVSSRSDGITSENQDVRVNVAAWRQRMIADVGHDVASDPVVGKIDKELWNEKDEDGFPAYDPRSPEYFHELTERLREEKPELFGAQRAKSKPRIAGGGGSQPPAGAGSGDPYAKGIPAEQIRAWKSAGVWNTKEQKARVRKAYFDQVRASQ